MVLPLLGTLLLAGCVSPPSGEAGGAVEHRQQAPWPSYQTEAAQNFIANCEKVHSEALKLFGEIERGSFPADMDLVRQLNKFDVIIDSLQSPSSLYRNVHPEADVRDAAETCEQRAAQIAVEFSRSRSVYDQLLRVPEASQSNLTKRYLNRTLAEFRRAGVDKDKATRERIRQLNDEIADLGQTFSNNIRADVRTVEASPAELYGLPRDFIDARPVNENGTVTLTTDAVDYIPVMQYAHSDSLRLRLYRQHRLKGHPANVPVLRSLLTKRHELAQLLGFGNYADYITADKMAGSAENVQSFLDQVNQLAKAPADKDYQVLLGRLQRTSPNATRVGDWQKAYLETQVKNELYQVDSQTVRSYFAYPKVRDGMFRLVEYTFGVEIRPWRTEVWHPSVESFEVWNRGRLVGQFYLDMQPREGKYGHGATFTVREGVKGMQTPVKALVGNFAGSSGTALMEHEQVEAFFHEMGHLMHGLFAGQQPWLKLSGIRTEEDFVQAPAQMLSKWVWDAGTLRAFARDGDNQVIPGVLVRQMRESRNFGRALSVRHQAYYAALSLEYHRRDPAEFDLDQLARELQEIYSPFDHVKGTHFYSGFEHLHGFSALYYSYLWSQAIAEDLFSEFERSGLSNSHVASRFRQRVLVPGGTRDAADLLRTFLGRPYSLEAYERSLQRP